MKSQALIVFVTTPNREVSDRLSKLVVGQKLAACANVLPQVRSLYWWKGKIQKDKEELLILKTQKSKWAKLSKTIRENHPYEVCEILALPAALGNPAYLKWIGESLS